MPGLSVQVPEQTRVSAIKDLQLPYFQLPVLWCAHIHTAHILTQCVTRIYKKKKKKNKTWITFVSEILSTILHKDLLVLLFYWPLEINEKLKL